MVLATLHLIALSPGKTIPHFLRALNSQSIKPLVTAKVVRWIIKPEKLSTHLTKQGWDLLVIVPSSTPIPATFLGEDWAYRHWSSSAGVPSRLFNNFHDTNRGLLHPSPGDVPELTGSLHNPRKATSTQGLELNDELLSWSKAFKLGQTGAVSMLNLLSFNPSKEAHDSYKTYGKAFAETIGSRRGGNAKLVGRIVPDQKTADEDKYGWDEFALAHYPSIRHFVDMLASEDYQKVNHESRLPALRDTCILCTTELDPEVGGDTPAAPGIMRETEGDKAKL
ncbi:hypothetical protein M409DRAFT_61941 [Zasmidium cellare ATCC 36951]|uniref:EthD domain-containing protein n=1 Tax=Zasmidium cellare ATCC 36951 TaxID=1080233 RepID=A0A6A6D2G3_ZASCE|nr:uncharacterized protein M409DRAFT_61941 [Zasmidium cellare ATCC 36951]KAF2173597.1 hypothetical protein M409DRAFT_61941 [Zasmidium cellare ATCC 36951]